MAVITEERAKRRSAHKAPASPRRSGVVITVLAFIVLAAVAVAVVLLNSGEDEATDAVVTAGGAEATQAVATPAAPSLRNDQQILADLANQGYIPAAAVDWRLLKTEQLANQGLIPAQTLQPYAAPTQPVFSESELLMMELARSGQIPMQAVDWTRVKTEQLVNQGLIPALTLQPYVAPTEPLFSESETLMIKLAHSGQIPMQAVDWEEVETTKLVNEGLIPREALSD